MKEEILQCRLVCVKSKHDPEGSRERDIHYANATKVLSQNFVAAKHFFAKNLEGSFESTKYTGIKSEYVGNLDKTKLLEARIMAYDMRDPFITPTLVDEYSVAVEDNWGNHAMTGVYLFTHWLKVFLRVVSQFQKYPYDNWNDDEDIVNCECTKEHFVNS